MVPFAFPTKAGFTLIEALLVVSVLAVLATLFIQDIAGLSDREKDREEIRQMQLLQRALSNFSDDNERADANAIDLPDQGDWFTRLAAYTNLSADEIQFDQWDRVRQYRKATIPQDFMINGETFTRNVEFSVLFSYGPDGEIDPLSVLEDLEPGDVEDPLEDFPGDAADALSTYELIEADGDDSMVKHTSNKRIFEEFEETAERIETIVGGLEKLARDFYNLQIGGGASLDDELFYPETTGLSLAVHASVRAYTNGFAGANSVDTGTNDVDDRRDGMVFLMRMLGLPDYYCCNALDGTPFFYYSNPRQDDGAGGCNVRPTTGPTFMPPKVTVEADPCG